MPYKNIVPVFEPDYPVNVIDSSTAAKLLSFCDKAEALGHLHDEQLQTIYAHRWFKMFVPEIYGGLQLSLPQGLQLQEALAFIDGSIGWTVTLCSGANWFVGFLPAHVSAEIFSHPQACLAGSGKATGEALVTSDGFIINGAWDYATGATHATIFTANCVVKGSAEDIVRSFWFKRADVQVQKSWNMMGMVATGSQRFSVNDLHVNKGHCFIIDAAKAILPQPVYQYPFLQFAEATLAANMCGMALHFLQLCAPLIKSSAIAVELLAQSNQQAERLRNGFYNAVNASWEMLVSKGAIEEPQLTQVSTTAKALANGVRKLVETLYPFCGMAAAERSTVINRVWRDMHTASQHVLLRP